MNGSARIPPSGQILIHDRLRPAPAATGTPSKAGSRTAPRSSARREGADRLPDLQRHGQSQRLPSRFAIKTLPGRSSRTRPTPAGRSAAGPAQPGRSPNSSRRTSTTSAATSPRKR
ncbi:MAG: hypothetical protein MZV70_49580 [Desulfobacterales bacterium]|nr:hypothetical protein [Desulfobacterales bacterium]